MTITFRELEPKISPELVVRLVEAAIQAKTDALELPIARILTLWSNPVLFAKDIPNDGQAPKGTQT